MDKELKNRSINLIVAIIYSLLIAAIIYSLLVGTYTITTAIFLVAAIGCLIRSYDLLMKNNGVKKR